MQRTLAIIKPDAVSNNWAGTIIEIIGRKFEITDMRMVHLTMDQAKEFYKVHEGKHFFEKNAEFMSSGPCIFMILEGEDAISRYRNLMGPTDHTLAPMGTLRHMFGTDITHNAVHGSDSEESANFEINFFVNL